METEVLEYRKVSAEVLGKPQLPKFKLGPFTYGDNWHPDTDANQMLMVWELIKKDRKEGLAIFMEAIMQWYVKDADIKLATMKAFMKYINSH